LRALDAFRAAGGERLLGPVFLNDVR
jgi:hypothetical protein